MDHRVVAGTGGAVLAAATLAVLTAASPWRPAGLPTGLVLLGVVAPAAAAAGVRLGLQAVGEGDGGAALIAGLGTPPGILLALFTINALWGTSGTVQLTALVLGTALAASLAVRFTGPALPEDQP